MGLFRLAVFGAIVVSVLPSDKEQQEKLYERTAAAAHWAVTFCDRNGATCAQAASMWDTFSAKAEFGARLALDLVRDSDSSHASAQKGPVNLEGRGTLKPEDLQPAWRGEKNTRVGSL